MSAVTTRTWYHLGIAVAVVAALFLLFGIGALGIIGAGGPPDLMYVGALTVGIAGVLVSRFRPRGMALSLGAAAASTFVAGLVAVLAGLQDTEGASVGEILMLSGMYAGLFALSAWFFWRSAEPAGAPGRRAA